MPQLTKKMADALIKSGGRHGKVGFHVANTVCAALLGRWVQLCDDGVDCTDPTHEHVDFQIR